MEFTVKSGNPEKQRTACVVVGVYEPRRPSPAAARLDEASGGHLGAVLRRGDLEGKPGQTLLLHQVPGTLCDRVLLVGCGRERELNETRYRQVLAAAARRLDETGAMEAVSYLPELAVRGRDLPWKVRLADMMASALAPTGAMFTFLALWTGAFWGKPTWGTYWVWDARLTSELILLFLYIGFISLQSAIDDPRRAAKASGLLAIVGVINLPIIYFSVTWWNTLHQGASVSPTMAPKMASIMLITMLIMVVAFWMYTIAVVLMRVRRIILERERQTTWVMKLVSDEKGATNE